MIDDDALDGRLFRARPDTPLRGAPLTGEQEELLASIMASAGVARPRRARGSKTVLERWSLAAALLLVLVVVSATVSVWPVQTSHAVAVTPRALQIQPLQGNAENLLLELSESVAAAAEPRPATTIRFEFWGLALSPQGSSVSMQPHETLLDYRSDGSTAVEPELCRHWRPTGVLLTTLTRATRASWSYGTSIRKVKRWACSQNRRSTLSGARCFERARDCPQTPMRPAIFGR